jgi:hypothetical protein
MEFSVKISPDEDGYTGRECPTCEKYFKIKFGTGHPGSPDCHCPYCNHVGPQNEFWTKQQIEYAKSVALNKVTGQLISQMKRLERRPDPRAFISIGITVKGNPTPIAYYSESELEERVTCSSCTLEYTIYGSFGYCPDCGIHNSLQIANANLDLVLKTLMLAQTASPDVATKLIENALEDAVSCFDGFGREHCADQTFKISFQSIEAAQQKLLREIGLDISFGMGADQWKFVCDQFQKRHLLAHKMGVIDSEFVSKTGCSSSLLGRKATVSDGDVRSLVASLRAIAEVLYHGIARG